MVVHSFEKLNRRFHAEEAEEPEERRSVLWYLWFNQRDQREQRRFLWSFCFLCGCVNPSVCLNV